MSSRGFAFTPSCCGDPDLDWVCLLCEHLSCRIHDPSPGEDMGICDQCWNPVDFPETEENIA